MGGAHFDPFWRAQCVSATMILLFVAMQLERSEFLGAEAYERTKSRRGYRNGFKGKRIRTRVGELRLEISQVRGLRFFLEKGPTLHRLKAVDSTCD